MLTMGCIQADEITSDSGSLAIIDNGNVASPIPLMAASWNVSAINNNPFEYWVTYPDPAYNDLMRGVQEFIDDAEQDVAVAEIFTDSMFADLCLELASHYISGLTELDSFWTHARISVAHSCCGIPKESRGRSQAFGVTARSHHKHNLPGWRWCLPSAHRDQCLRHAHVLDGRVVGSVAGLHVSHQCAGSAPRQL
jgi:hypothetical protein